MCCLLVACKNEYHSENQDSGKDLTGQLWLQVFCKVAVKDVSLGHSHLKAQLGLKDLFPGLLIFMGIVWRPQFYAGCWQEASILCHMDLPVEVLPSSRLSYPRECKGEVLLGPPSMVRSDHCFCWILLATQTNPDPRYQSLTRCQSLPTLFPKCSFHNSNSSEAFCFLQGKTQAP